MSKPSFYNDNEYRSYPFVDQPAAFEALEDLFKRLPNAAIVDAGFIMNLDAQYEDESHIVYLASVSAETGTLFLRFANTSPACAGKLITFRRDYVIGDDGIIAVDPEWTTEHTEAEAAANYCPVEPTWVGFLVTAKIEPLVALALAAGGTITFGADVYVIEPARIQNLNKAYLRSVRVGNYSRITAPPCDADVPTAEQEILLDPRCLTGDIKFKEGYNTKITQISNANTLTFTSVKGSGAKEDSDLCDNYGEIPLYDGELANKPYIYVGDEQTPGRRSKFLSGGWSCKDLIFTINGLGGSNVNIVGGKNIQVGYDGETGAITVKLSDTAQGSCNG